MKTLLTPAMSKFLGWDSRSIQVYPTMDQVEHATDIQLCRWYRFLTSPVTLEEVYILNAIMGRVYPIKKEEPIDKS